MRTCRLKRNHVKVDVAVSISKYSFNIIYFNFTIIKIKLIRLYLNPYILSLWLFVPMNLTYIHNRVDDIKLRSSFIILPIRLVEYDGEDDYNEEQ